MKTFTTYAEKKAKQFLNLLQGYTKGIRITAILILLLMGVNNAWGATIFNCGIEVNETWYKGTGTINSGNWLGNQTAFNNKDFGVITSLKLGGQYDTWDNNQTDNCSWNASNGITITIKKDSTQKDQFKLSCYHSGKDGNNNVWKTTGTIGQCGDKNAYGRYTHNISQYAAGNDYTIAAKWFSPSGISTTGTAKFTIPGFTTTSTSQTFDNTTVNNNSSKTISFGTHYGTTLKTNNCSISGTNHTEFSVTSITESEVTVKFTPTSAGDKSATLTITDAHNKTCTITLTGTAILPTYTVTFGVHSSGNGTLTAKAGSTSISSGASIDEGTTVVFTASPSTGYQIEGWYSNSTCTTSLSNGTNSTYTISSLTADKTVYVKFEEIPATSHNITYTPQKTGWTYDANNPKSAEEGEKVSFTVTPATGYSVTVKSDVDLEKNGNTYTFEMPSKDVEIAVTATEILSTITIVTNPTEGGSVTVDDKPFTPGNTVQVGVATTKKVTAVPNEGYGVAAWGVSNKEIVNASGGATVTLKSDGSGSTGTLYANFIGLEYTITFNKQEGTNGTDKATVRYKNNEYSVSPVVAPNRAGYTFGGYYTQAAGAGVQVVSAEGQWLANATGYTDADRKWVRIGDATLYAKWVELPPTTIYIRSNGSYADFKWNNNNMTPMDCGGTYYTANIPASVNEITLTGSNSFTTTALTVPTDGKVLYDLTSTNITHLYLKPNSNWKQSNAWFAAYFFGNGEKWVKMLDEDSDGVYSCEIPTDKQYPSVIFVRMNKDKSELGWNSKWNQSGDLTVPTDGKNLFTLPDGVWDGATTTWSTIYDNSKWTTFEAPTLNVQVNITGKGSIVIDGETYTSITTGTETFAFTKASGENIAVGAITPADRWAYNTAAQITMCDETIDLAASHTINGPATINLSFTQTKCEVVFNLGIPKGVPIPNWTINNQYIDPNDTVVKPTVGEINGYLFGGWYTTGEYSDATLYNFGTPVTKDIELYARWVRYEECIFFKNNLNWDKIYVYTFTGDEDVWGDKGVTPKKNRNNFGQMTRIGLSDVYYYILKDLNGFYRIAFSDYDMSNYNEFWEHNAIYRADRKDQMQLFIPERDQTAKKYNNTSYFSSGIWMKYNSTESGYKWSSDKNSWSTNSNPFTAPITGGYTFTVKVFLSGDTWYKFKLNDINEQWYGRVGTMTQDDCTDWWFQNKTWGENEDNGNAKIEPNVTGEYLFTLYLGDGKVMVSLEYPLSVGDYRLAYQDNTDDSFHPGHYIRKRSIDYKDTVSFFVHRNQQPQIVLQHCTAIDPATATATWETDNTYSVNVEATSVYNFVLQQTDSRAELLTDATHLYTGEFYIRTDAAEGGWDYFRQTANLMNFSTYASDHEHFTHYFCRWITANKNVKFTIGNDYSLCISDTLDGDDLIRKENVAEGTLPVDANVRFTWDNRDNTITRAYIAGSAWTRDRFLVLAGNEHLKDTDGNPFLEGELESDRDGLLANEVMFKDLGNWIYQTDVTVNAQTLIRLIATYNKSVQYFKGSEAEPINLLSTTASKDYKVRLIYDFKTNHLVVAWLAGGNTVDGEDQELGADMMIIRHNQNGAEQLQFNPNSNTLSGVGTGYAVMTFDKYFLNNLDEEGNELPEKKSQYERAFYWVSFPFDVKLRDVFGFGEYGQHWIMEYYDGAARAANGYWIDSDTYWKYITNLDYTLKAGQGYVLCLNLNKMGTSSTVFTNTSEVSLYFPSTSPLQTITGAVTTAIVPEHKCTIERDNRNIYDSNWNLIGVPGFKDITNIGVGGSAHDTIADANVTEKCLNFYYKYIPKDNKYEATDNTKTNDFQTMFSYMVQFAGIVEWSTPEFVKGISARRVGNMPSEHTLRLEFLQSETLADQTIIKLQEKDATADFDMNIDMAKMMNSGTNIYTMTANTNIMVGGNALPIARTTVPVGVRVDATGEYTFRMPDGTDGISVILLDNQTGAHTNMLYDEYTVTLDAGTYENRFSLSVDPNRSATSVENIFGDGNEENGDKATGVKKFIIDGQLFIRTTNGLFDAKGQRL